MVLAGIVILAGGHSKRMGTPKAQLTLPTGEQLLDYHVRQASKLNVPVMIADNGRGFSVDEQLINETKNSKTDVCHIVDYAPLANNESNSKQNSSTQNNDTGGALVAIESALQVLIKSGKIQNEQDKRQASWLLVISCDSLVSAFELWSHFQECATTIDNNKSVVCLSDDSNLYPLLGLYRLDIEPDLCAYIDNGQRRVMRFVEPISHAVAISPRWYDLTNFNTPIEFERACHALSNR